jgi:hypothetical protein
MYVNDALGPAPLTRYFYSNNNRCADKAAAEASDFAGCAKTPAEQWSIRRKDQ